MKRSMIYFIAGIVLLIICFSAYLFIFNIYETEINVVPQNLFADNHSTISVSIIPINSFGWKVPFRHVRANFIIKEGKQLVDIVEESKYGDTIILRAKDKTGKVEVYVKSEYSLLPSLIEINVYPNLALNDQRFKNF